MAEQVFEARDIIFREGDSSEVAYLIVSGSVEILKSAASGEVKLAEIGSGDTFGEMGLFDQLPRSATARAKERTVVQQIGEIELHAMLDQCPKALAAIVQAVFRRLRQVNERVSQAEQATILLDSDISTLRFASACDAFQSTVKTTDIPIAQLPYRVGGYPEEGQPARYDNNNLYLPSDGPPLTISRHHFEIAIDQGGIFLFDKGSRFGTVVNGVQIGRGRGVYKTPLKEGENLIQIGGKTSAYAISVTCMK